MKKLFIGHNENDEKYASALVNLLITIGVPKQNAIFCSSHPDHQVPIGTNFMQYIEGKLREETMVLFLLSENFCKSKMCQTESGAVWALKLPYLLLAVPSFDYNNIPAPFERETSAVRLNQASKVDALKKNIELFFSLDPIDTEAWAVQRKNFIHRINNLCAKDGQSQNSDTSGKPTGHSGAQANHQVIVHGHSYTFNNPSGPITFNR